MVLKSISAHPGCSTSTKAGWNIHSGASNRSEPTLITRPSGSCHEEVRKMEWVRIGRTNGIVFY